MLAGRPAGFPLEAPADGLLPHLAQMVERYHAPTPPRVFDSGPSEIGSDHSAWFVSHSAMIMPSHAGLERC
jgi:hypothetical protein